MQSLREGRLCGTFLPVTSSTHDPSLLQHDRRGGRIADCEFAALQLQHVAKAVARLQIDGTDQRMKHAVSLNADKSGPMP